MLQYEIKSEIYTFKSAAVFLEFNEFFGNLFMIRSTQTIYFTCSKSTISNEEKRQLEEVKNIEWYRWMNHFEFFKKKIIQGNSECDICFLKLKKGVELACAHNYHRQCILKWYDVSKTCPKCRRKIKYVWYHQSSTWNVSPPKKRTIEWTKEYLIFLSM